MITRVLGVDVGLTTAHAAIYGYRDRPVPRLLYVQKIPTTPDGKRINVERFHAWVKDQSPDIAYVENATAMGAGTVSGYLKAAGAIEASIVIAGVHMVPVMPSVWMDALGVDADKKNSVILARELFSNHAVTTFKYWKSHNAAQAALIALYGASRCDMVSLKVAA
jgi:hypothetical protein